MDFSLLKGSTAFFLKIKYKPNGDINIYKAGEFKFINYSPSSFIFLMKYGILIPILFES